MQNCDGLCQKPKVGECSCGLFRDGVMVRNGSIRIPIILMDRAAPTTERKTLAMMTDADIRDMRVSVRGMPVSKAALLPIYDEFRGMIDDGGVPMERMRALCDGAVYDGSGIAATPENAMAIGDAEYAYRKMVADMGGAHRQPVNDNRPTHTRDGRLIDSLPEHERAYQRMVADMADASKPEA
jgi:hypothetical protein